MLKLYGWSRGLQRDFAPLEARGFAPGRVLVQHRGLWERDERGRHTTTRRELIRLPSGALILDTPGMRELGLVDADEGLSTAFAAVELSVEALAADCRFRDCRHAREPGCAVRAALQDGRLAPDRFEAWRKLQRELQHEREAADPLARQAREREWISLMKSARVHIRNKRRGPE